METLERSYDAVSDDDVTYDTAYDPPRTETESVRVVLRIRPARCDIPSSTRPTSPPPPQPRGRTASRGRSAGVSTTAAATRPQSKGAPPRSRSRKATAAAAAAAAAAASCDDGEVCVAALSDGRSVHVDNPGGPPKGGGGGGGGGGKVHVFDRVFQPGKGGREEENDAVYAGAVEGLVSSFTDGFNATVLAYGQTGSGKTHTISGIIPRALEQIFRTADASHSSTVSVSYLEVYHDSVIDILTADEHTRLRPHSADQRRRPRTHSSHRPPQAAHAWGAAEDTDDEDEARGDSQRAVPAAPAPSGGGPLCSIRDGGNGIVMVSGLKVVKVRSPAEALECLRRGDTVRKTASTLMNNQSSRSHVIFTVYMERVVYDGDSAQVLCSKLHIVDLAGSERNKRTGNVGVRMKESININTGLLALGNVVSALAKRGTDKSVYVPFRGSKLTRLLQDALGGQSKTVFLACLSPSAIDHDESASTLAYAARAMKILNNPPVAPPRHQLELLKAEQHAIHTTFYGYRGAAAAAQEPAFDEEHAEATHAASGGGGGGGGGFDGLPSNRETRGAGVGVDSQRDAERAAAAAVAAAEHRLRAAFDAELRSVREAAAAELAAERALRRDAEEEAEGLRRAEAAAAEEEVAALRERLDELSGELEADEGIFAEYLSENKRLRAENETLRLASDTRSVATLTDGQPPPMLAPTPVASAGAVKHAPSETTVVVNELTHTLIPNVELEPLRARESKFESLAKENYLLQKSNKKLKGKVKEVEAEHEGLVRRLRDTAMERDAARSMLNGAASGGGGGGGGAAGLGSATVVVSRDMAGLRKASLDEILAKQRVRQQGLQYQYHHVKPVEEP